MSTSRYFLNSARAGAIAIGMASLLMAPAAQADFVNGNFASGDFTGWTEDAWFNSGIPSADFPPQSEADLGLADNSPETPKSAVLPAGSAGVTSGNLAWSGNAARVHTDDKSSGNNRRGSSIRQSFAVTAADREPDGKVHVYFNAAAVLENPVHADEQQPYAFIELVNEDTGDTLWSTFNFGGEAGVPWQSGTGEFEFTDWQAFEVALNAADLADGDNLRFTAIAAGCVPTAHTGAVYLQDIRTTKALQRSSLWVSAQGPSSVCLNANGPTRVTYTYTYENNGNDPMTGVEIELVLPQTAGGDDTDFVSITNPTFGGGSCSGPANPGDPATCDIGDLQPGEQGTFSMTVEIPAGATGATLNNGNYTITGQDSGGNPVTQLGTLVRTALDANCPVAIAPVPTLGQWALMLLAGLLGVFGLSGMRRRRLG